MNPREHIKLESLSLQYDETTRAITCPWCESRDDIEKGSLVVTRLSQGLIYSCFRVKCKAKGFISSNTSELYDRNPSEKVKKEPKLFTRPLKELPQNIKNWLFAAYNITDNDIYKNHLSYDYTVNYLYMPISDSHWGDRGACIKKLPKELVKRKIPNLRYYLQQQKVVHYWFDTSYCKLYWPKIDYLSEKNWIIIVEDALSAIRMNQFCPTVAILGTNLIDVMVTEIRKHTKKVCLALDADTLYTGSSTKLALPYRLQQKYSLYFDEFKIAQITKDPKSLSDEEINQQILEVCK